MHTLDREPSPSDVDRPVKRRTWETPRVITSEMGLTRMPLFITNSDTTPVVHGIQSLS